ncbi:MAG TPA: molybdate ABC transporter substrate-binding protein [Opitutaceae bacterium]|nr:molybdate ABC transporter substrate-binding protein [Opitutaceae bacterium]
MRLLRRVLLLLLALAGVARAPAAGGVTVAAAANLVYVLAPLRAEFERTHPGVRVVVETGSSGNLVAMISNGAPYDVFLSADLEFPRQLVQSGGGVDGTLVTFAYGRLVLWTTRKDLEWKSVAEAVRDPRVARIAIANPRTAPFGRATEETLAQLGLGEVARPKLVFAQDIGQAAQYVSSGNADAGFVALSLVAAPKLKHTGRWLAVPERLYVPIAEGAVLTRFGAGNAMARDFLQFLVTPAARTIFQEYGYGLPAPSRAKRR